MKPSKSANTPAKIEVTAGSVPVVEEEVQEKAEEAVSGIFTRKVKPSQPLSIICGNEIIYQGTGVTEVSYTIPG